MGLGPPQPGFAKGGDSGAVFDVDGKVVTCVVQPWDGRSFIAPGTNRPQAQWRNTSFLHNAFFSPAVLDTDLWVRCPGALNAAKRPKRAKSGKSGTAKKTKRKKRAESAKK